MAIISTNIMTNETVYQNEFYRQLFGDDYSTIVTVDRSTDGYTNGILFEHKANVTSYGEAKALSQALIYLTRFNRDGVPVPRFICLVSQEEEKCFIYDARNYAQYINDIPQYANMKASDGIPNFSKKIGGRFKTINYQLGNVAHLKELYDFIGLPAENVKVDINEHNVYGWATFYYDNAAIYKQKPEKKSLFEELAHPVGVLKDYINPWTGKESDFKYIMDMLNDPMTQKKLGAFYTPPTYAKKAVELVYEAISRVPKGNDYVIIDRCAGTGNLEMYLDDKDEDVLSHVIVSTYELKEWMVLRDRFGKRVRYIVPPIPNTPGELPELNEEGFLSGANALTRELLDNAEIKKYLDNPKCTIILYENPPYAETTSIEFQKIGQGADASSWKNTEMVQEMKKENTGAASNDMANVFIWSAFKYFLRQPTDSYIVFSPVKYWKAQHIVNKKFIRGFAFNRKHFHAKTDACIMCALWSNENDALTTKLKLTAYNLDANHALIDEGELYVKKINSLYSEKYYDSRKDPADTADGIACELDGTETTKTEKQVRVPKTYNSNIVGYMAIDSAGMDNPRLHACLTIGGKYNGNGFYVRKDNFVEKLPMFAASRYTDNCNDWKIMSLIMKTGDKAEQFYADVAAHKLDIFLCKCLIWSCMTHYAHMRSMVGSDGRLYRNELCFDGDTTATQALNEFIARGYALSAEEIELFEKYNMLLDMVRTPNDDKTPKENYDPRFTYGLYQIDEEINLKDKIQDAKGNVRSVPRYGDLNNLIKDMKALLKTYYLNNLVDTLLEYEFLK